MLLTVFASLNEDVSSGWVWVPAIKEGARPTVKITNLINKKSIYCEVLQIDSNFTARYNEPPRKAINNPNQSVVMCAWYRGKLGVRSGESTDLEITLIKRCPDGYIKACLQHPQLTNRVAVWLGLVGVLLAIISFIPFAHLS